MKVQADTLGPLSLALKGERGTDMLIWRSFFALISAFWGLFWMGDLLCDGRSKCSSFLKLLGTREYPKNCRINSMVKETNTRLFLYWFHYIHCALFLKDHFLLGKWDWYFMSSHLSSTMLKYCIYLKNRYKSRVLQRRNKWFNLRK